MKFGGGGRGYCADSMIRSIFLSEIHKHSMAIHKIYDKGSFKIHVYRFIQTSYLKQSCFSEVQKQKRVNWERFS